MENIENSKIEEFVAAVFDAEPKEPKSLYLELSPKNEENRETKKGEEDLNNQTLNNFLINLYLIGIKKVYGEDTQLQDVVDDSEKFKYMNKYMQSFGFDSKYEYVYNENNLPVNLNLWFEKL